MCGCTCCHRADVCSGLHEVPVCAGVRVRVEATPEELGRPATAEVLLHVVLICCVSSRKLIFYCPAQSLNVNVMLSVPRNSYPTCMLIRVMVLSDGPVQQPAALLLTRQPFVAWGRRVSYLAAVAPQPPDLSGCPLGDLSELHACCCAAKRIV
jgi:hypothetical protein